jgi:hypothetical protein
MVARRDWRSFSKTVYSPANKKVPQPVAKTENPLCRRTRYPETFTVGLGEDSELPDSAMGVGVDKR